MAARRASSRRWGVDRRDTVLSLRSAATARLSPPRLRSRTFDPACPPEPSVLWADRGFHYWPGSCWRASDASPMASSSTPAKRSSECWASHSVRPRRRARARRGAPVRPGRRSPRAAPPRGRPRRRAPRASRSLPSATISLGPNRSTATRRQLCTPSPRRAPGRTARARRPARTRRRPTGTPSTSAWSCQPVEEDAAHAESGDRVGRVLFLPLARMAADDHEAGGRPRAVAGPREGLDEQREPLDRGEAADGEHHHAVDEWRNVLGADSATLPAAWPRTPAARLLRRAPLATESTRDRRRAG